MEKSLQEMKTSTQGLKPSEIATSLARAMRLC